MKARNTSASTHFTGQREDATIGLYFYNARYYDPYLGRFISADTVVPNPGNPQDLNRYAYVRNNPLRYTDPSGCYSEDEIMQSFGVSTWDQVLAHFMEGGALAGRWGWLEILRQAQDRDWVEAEPHEWIDGKTPIAANCGEGYVCGCFGGYFSRNEEGRILVGYGAHSEFALRHDEYTLHTRTLLGYLGDYPFHTRAERIHYRLKFDSSRVNWADVTLDSIGTVASVVGANPVAQAFKYGPKVATAAQTVDQGLNWFGLGKAVLVDMDPNETILATGGFVPGPVGGGFNLASVYFDLEPGFYWTP